MDYFLKAAAGAKYVGSPPCLPAITCIFEINVYDPHTTPRRKFLHIYDPQTVNIKGCGVWGMGWATPIMGMGRGAPHYGVDPTPYATPYGGSQPERGP